jgi:hypothetical protein
LAGERMQRRLAAVLAANVADYGRLMGDDDEGTLTRLKAVRSSFAYKCKTVDIRQGGHEPGVRYVLEGSVRNAGSRLLPARPILRSSISRPRCDRIRAPRARHGI